MAVGGHYHAPTRGRKTSLIIKQAENGVIECGHEKLLDQLGGCSSSAAMCHFHMTMLEIQGAHIARFDLDG